MGPYDLIRPAKALGSSTHARTWCDSVPSPEPEEWSDTDSQDSYTSSMTRSLEIPRRSAPLSNPRRVNSMSFLELHYPLVSMKSDTRADEHVADQEKAAKPVVNTTPTAVVLRPTISLEPVRSTQRGHHPIISRRPTPYAEELRATLFEAIERCTGASERDLDGAIAAGAWYDDLDETFGDDDEEWVVVEAEDGEEQWEVVGTGGGAA